MFIDKQTITKKKKEKKKKSGNLIIFNFRNIGNMWASKETKLVIRIAFFCSKLCDV